MRAEIEPKPTIVDNSQKPLNTGERRQSPEDWRRTYEQALRGNPEATNSVFETLLRKLFKRLSHRSPPVPWSEPGDFAQIGVIGALPYFQGERGEKPPAYQVLEALALRIAKNALIDEKRKGRRERGGEVLEDYREDPPPIFAYPRPETHVKSRRGLEDEVLNRVAAEEVVPELWEAFEQLTEGQQRVIWLRIIDGLSTRETAEALGTTPGVVKSRLHRGLQGLRRAFGVLE